MPIYTFENINTGEEITLEMKISELDDFKTNHPELQQLIQATPLVDPILVGVKKPPRDFQEGVLKRIKKGNRGSTIGSGRWDV